MKIHPDVLAAHAQFGGDIETMQKAYEHHSLVVRLSDAEARIAELERERDAATGTLRFCEQQWAEERGTMIDKFVFERARAEAAESQISEIAGHLDGECDSDSILHVIREVQADRDIYKARAEAAEALLKEAKTALEPFTKYAQDDCFKGSTKWELVECDRPGGAWFGAEDFRAARAIHDKIGGRAS